LGTARPRMRKDQIPRHPAAPQRPRSGQSRWRHSASQRRGRQHPRCGYFQALTGTQWTSHSWTWSWPWAETRAARHKSR